LSVLATNIYDVFEVEQDGTKFTEGVDWEFISTGHGVVQAPDGNYFKQLHWISGASNYPVSGSYYSVKYAYDAFIFSVDNTGVY